jgi:hypothetical protein
MEPTTSFIPKKAVVEERKAEGSVGLLTAFVVIFFLVTLLTTVGMFLWKKSSDQNLVSTQKNFEELKNRFQPELIADLKRMDDRLNSAASLTSQHISPSKFLTFLQSVTFKDVRFTSFNYTFEETGLKFILKGQAKNYAIIAMQSDAFKNNKYIKEYLFSNLNPEANGLISFDISMSVDPSFVLFDNKNTQ